MSVKTEGNYLGDWLKAELFAPNYCREQITITAGQNLVTGTVVGKVTGTGNYVIYDNTAGTGAEAAAGILIADVDATGIATKPGVILARGPAIVSKAGLTWNAAGDVSDGLADLKLLGIIAREGV